MKPGSHPVGVAPPPGILLVDDDRSLLETTAALLEDEGRVITAASGEEALRLLPNADVQIVCADFQMPGMDGIELLRQIHRLDARRIGILVTGYRDRLPTGLAGDAAIFSLIYKPYKPEALIEAIREASKFRAMSRAATKFQNSAFRLGTDGSGQKVHGR